MKKRGRKELLIDVLEHRTPEKVPFGEMHVNAAFIEKYMGQKYRGTMHDIEFSLEIDRQLIKPEMFWFGTKWKNANGKAFDSVGKLMEHAKNVPVGIGAELRDKIKDTLKMAHESNLLMVVQLAGVLSYAWSMVGFENFLMDLIQDQGNALEVIDLIVTRNCEYASQLAELGVEAVHLTDDIAGNDGILISPNTYRELIKPALKKIIDSCEDMYIIYHSDGNIAPVLGDLIEMGIDGFHSIEYGQMDLKQTKENYKEISLFGNVDMSVLHIGTPKEIDALVKEAVEAGGPGNFAICSDNSIPSFIPVGNFQAYVEAVKKYT